MKLLTACSALFAVAHGRKSRDAYFQRVAVFPVCSQLSPTCNDDSETVAEIVTASVDGKKLVYSDSQQGVVGFVDISDPAHPVADGIIAVGGEPTSVAVTAQYALLAVNDSPNYVDVAGRLIVIHIDTREVVATIDLGGQPDSVAVSPDGRFAAVCIENQRDEDLGDGVPPQMPAGFVVVIELTGEPSEWTSTVVDVTGLENVLYNTDPEPEFVSINHNNIAAITLQENNAIVLIDLETKSVVQALSAGSVDLDQIDLTEEDIILQVESQAGTLREPDGVTWIDNQYFVTADEGDLDGGSRGFTVFDSFKGSIVYSSGNLLDHEAAAIGHYPESRSGNKGSEPENVAFGVFNGEPLLFINSERAHVAFVFDVSDPTHPVYKQVLPTGVGPEGAAAIPGRNLMVVASEVDSRDDKIRSVINIFQGGFKNKSYPTLYSTDRDDGTPIAWGAISGLAAEIRVAFSKSSRKSKGKNKGKKKVQLYAVEDSYYSKSRVFTIDASIVPARIIDEMRIVDTVDALKNSPLGADLVNEDNTVNLDLEGVAVSRSGGLWVCSEGSGTVGDAARPVASLNYLIKLNNQGEIMTVVTLPDEVNDIQFRFGFEGCAEGSGNYGDKVIVVFQRAWVGEENPRLGAYDQVTGSWSFYFYPLDMPESQFGGWVGLSDIAPLGDGGKFLVLERDDQGGPDGVIKRIYKIDLANHSPGETVSKTLVRDLVPDLLARGGLLVEKVEGLTVDSGGNVWVVNDNDGVDDNSGETLLLNVMKSAYSPSF